MRIKTRRGTTLAVLGVLLVAALLLSGGPVEAKKPPKPPPPPPPPAGPAYTLIDLGTLGGDYSEATSINEAGQVVGWAQNSDGVKCPFLVTPEDTDDDGKPDRWYRDDDSDGVNDLMISLGLLGGDSTYFGIARDINDHGVVVGVATLYDADAYNDRRTHEWVWKDLDANGESDEGEMVDLGATPSDGAIKRTVAINDHGQILAVGPDDHDVFPARYCIVTPEDTDDDGEPDLWFEDENQDGVNDLELDLGDDYVWLDINDAGMLVGKEPGHSGNSYLLVPEDTDDDGRPDSWWCDDDSDGVNDLLVELPGIEDRWRVAERLNNSGQAVGSGNSTVKSGYIYMIHAIRWETDQTPTDLGSPGKKIPSQGVAINDAGDVVGYGDGEGDGLLCLDDTLYELMDLLTNPSGIEYVKVLDIDDSGHIVGRTNRGAFISVPTGD